MFFCLFFGIVLGENAVFLNPSDLVKARALKKELGDNIYSPGKHFIDEFQIYPIAREVSFFVCF